MNSIEYKLMIRFYNKAPDDTVVTGVFSELSSSLGIFLSDEGLRYALRGNPQKCDPGMLLQGESIYLNIPESKLSAYADSIQMVCTQILSQMERRKETDSDPIAVVLDELPRITAHGKLEKLMDGIHTLRSRHVSIIMAAQDRESLITAFTEEEVASLENNSWITILSARSEKTIHAVQVWCGKYSERHETWRTERDTDVSITFSDHDVIEGTDLITLPAKDELIVIGPMGFYRCKKAF